jgi:hypothetical protein
LDYALIGGDMLSRLKFFILNSHRLPMMLINPFWNQLTEKALQAVEIRIGKNSLPIGVRRRKGYFLRI